MSRFYEASQKSEKARRKLEDTAPGSVDEPMKLAEGVNVGAPTAHKTRLVNFEIPIESRLVAVTEPQGLGAEKFRVLATRLENLRNTQKDLKSLQVISAVNGEGKTLIAGNLALTLAKCSQSRVLLIEGDLHNPNLAALFGLSQLPGVTDWWSGARPDINHSLYQLQDLPLWLLPAGGTCEQPSKILESPRFAEAFAQLSWKFDWIVVDSSPMVSTFNVNLWSRLVDGTLVVVREGVAPVKVLKRGLVSLDKPRLLGVVFNETSDLDRPAGDDI